MHQYFTTFCSQAEEVYLITKGSFLDAIDEFASVHSPTVTTGFETVIGIIVYINAERLDRQLRCNWEISTGEYKE